MAVGGPEMPLESDSPGGKASNLTEGGSGELYPVSSMWGESQPLPVGTDAAEIQTTALLSFCHPRKKTCLLYKRSPERVTERHQEGNEESHSNAEIAN